MFLLINGLNILLCKIPGFMLLSMEELRDGVGIMVFDSLLLLLFRPRFCFLNCEQA